MKKLLFAFIVLNFSASLRAQSVTVFKGQPTIKISEGGVERYVEKVTKGQASNLACIISEIGGQYYWASRENLELSEIKSGTFTTFFAKNGSGYVRILEPGMKKEASVAGGAESTYDYVEHLLIGLKSVTYYGLEAK